MKYVVIDTETTGLDKNTHELLAFGAIVMINGNIVEQMDIKIRPQHLESADPEALKVNGYSERRWSMALTLEHASFMIYNFFCRHGDGTLVGHNVQFDIGFITTCCRPYYNIPISRPYIDTRDVCRAVLPHFGASSMSLDNICAFLGWERRQAHTALSDCEDCIKILQNLCPPSPKFLIRLHIMKSIRTLKGLL